MSEVRYNKTDQTSQAKHIPPSSYKTLIYKSIYCNIIVPALLNLVEVNSFRVNSVVKLEG